jgi:hypothetical protein
MTKTRAYPPTTKKSRHQGRRFGCQLSKERKLKTYLEISSLMPSQQLEHKKKITNYRIDHPKTNNDPNQMTKITCRRTPHDKDEAGHAHTINDQRSHICPCQAKEHEYKIQHCMKVKHEIKKCKTDNKFKINQILSA